MSILKKGVMLKVAFHLLTAVDFLLDKCGFYGEEDQIGEMRANAKGR